VSEQLAGPIRVPLTVTCRVLKIARQPYYRCLEDPVTDADLQEAHRANALLDAHRDDPEFGYRFLNWIEVVSVVVVAGHSSASASASASLCGRCRKAAPDRPASPEHPLPPGTCSGTDGAKRDLWPRDLARE
jgi:putative transposase